MRQGIGRLESLWGTMVAGLAIGVAQACLTPFDALSPYRTITPFLFAIVALLWYGAAGRGLSRA